MRGKRSKAYRRQMEAYVRGFSFREPYQVLVDSEFVRETGRCAMVLEERVAQALHGKIKPSKTPPAPSRL
jgi:U3 small nucleolar RNA-associated protein 23